MMNNNLLEFCSTQKQINTDMCKKGMQAECCFLSPFMTLLVSADFKLFKEISHIVFIIQLMNHEIYYFRSFFIFKMKIFLISIFLSKHLVKTKCSILVKKSFFQHYFAIKISSLSSQLINQINFCNLNGSLTKVFNFYLFLFQ